MVDPKESYVGLRDWARTAGATPDTQINADTLDNQHYTDLKAEWEAYANNTSGGVAHAGAAFFAGNEAVRAITFTTPMSDVNYIPIITPSANTNASVGEYWVQNLTVNGFEVVNTGGADTGNDGDPGRTLFKWAVLPY